MENIYSTYYERILKATEYVLEQECVTVSVYLKGGTSRTYYNPRFKYIQYGSIAIDIILEKRRDSRYYYAPNGTILIYDKNAQSQLKRIEKMLSLVIEETAHAINKKGDLHGNGFFQAFAKIWNAHRIQILAILGGE